MGSYNKSWKTKFLRAIHKVQNLLKANYTFGL